MRFTLFMAVLVVTALWHRPAAAQDDAQMQVFVDAMTECAVLANVQYVLSQAAVRSSDLADVNDQTWGLNRVWVHDQEVDQFKLAAWTALASDPSTSRAARALVARNVHQRTEQVLHQEFGERKGPKDYLDARESYVLFELRNMDQIEECEVMRQAWE